jgi:serine protease AprX
VSGVVALLLEADPALTPSRVEQILTETAQDFGPAGYDIAWGFGEIDAFAAVLAALG